MALHYYNPAELKAADEWNRIVNLLSLDVFAAFYSLAGLRPGNPAQFCNLLRKLILDGRKEFPETNPARVLLRREHLLDHTEIVLGRKARRNLEDWSNYVFPAAMQEPLSTRPWTQILNYATHTLGAWASLHLPAGLDEECRRRFKASVDLAGFEQRRDEIRACPLSDWDLHMYALCLLDDESVSSYDNPWDCIERLVNGYQALRFWSWLLNNFAPGELSDLQRNALALIRPVKELVGISELPWPDVKGVSSE